MDDLRKRFGHLVAAHRRRAGMTQHRLAEAADLSDDMIARIEVGKTGASFPSIEKIASALKVDPAELFSADPVPGRKMRRPLQNLAAKLARLSDQEIAWAEKVLDAALERKV